MNLWLIICGFIIILGIFLCFLPFSKKYIFDRWGKIVSILCGVIAIVAGVVHLAWDLKWFTLSKEIGQQFHIWYVGIWGFQLGLLLCLAISRQGKKRTPQIS